MFNNEWMPNLCMYVVRTLIVSDHEAFSLLEVGPRSSAYSQSHSTGSATLPLGDSGDSVDSDDLLR